MTTADTFLHHGTLYWYCAEDDNYIYAERDGDGRFHRFRKDEITENK